MTNSQKRKEGQPRSLQVSCSSDPGYNGEGRSGTMISEYPVVPGGYGRRPRRHRLEHIEKGEVPLALSLAFDARRSPPEGISSIIT